MSESSGYFNGYGLWVGGGDPPGGSGGSGGGFPPPPGPLCFYCGSMLFFAHHPVTRQGIWICHHCSSRRAQHGHQHHGHPGHQHHEPGHCHCHGQHFHWQHHPGGQYMNWSQAGPSFQHYVYPSFPADEFGFPTNQPGPAPSVPFQSYPGGRPMSQGRAPPRSNGENRAPTTASHNSGDGEESNSTAEAEEERDPTPEPEEERDPTPEPEEERDPTPEPEEERAPTPEEEPEPTPEPEPEAEEEQEEEAAHETETERDSDGDTASETSAATTHVPNPAPPYTGRSQAPAPTPRVSNPAPVYEVEDPNDPIYLDAMRVLSEFNQVHVTRPAREERAPPVGAQRVQAYRDTYGPGSAAAAATRRTHTARSDSGSDVTVRRGPSANTTSANPSVGRSSTTNPTSGSSRQSSTHATTGDVSSMGARAARNARVLNAREVTDVHEIYDNRIPSDDVSFLNLEDNAPARGTSMPPPPASSRASSSLSRSSAYHDAMDTSFLDLGNENNAGPSMPPRPASSHASSSRSRSSAYYDTKGKSYSAGSSAHQNTIAARDASFLDLRDDDDAAPVMPPRGARPHATSSTRSSAYYDTKDRKGKSPANRSSFYEDAMAAGDPSFLDLRDDDSVAPSLPPSRASSRAGSSSRSAAYYDEKKNTSFLDLGGNDDGPSSMPPRAPSSRASSSSRSSVYKPARDTSFLNLGNDSDSVPSIPPSRASSRASSSTRSSAYNDTRDKKDTNASNRSSFYREALDIGDVDTSSIDWSQHSVGSSSPPAAGPSSRALQSLYEAEEDDDFLTPAGVLESIYEIDEEAETPGGTRRSVRFGENARDARR